MILTWVDVDGDELDLTEDNGFCLLVGTAGLDVPPRSLITAQKITHGATLIADRHEARNVVLALDVLDESPDLDVREIIGDVADRFQGPGTLRMHRDYRSRDLRNVYYESGLAGEEREVPFWQRVAVSLLALDPFWYDPTESITLWPPQVNDDYDAPLAYDLPLPYDGPGAGISAGTGYDEAISYDAALAYDGGAVVSPLIVSKLGAWPTFTFTGPATFAQITHLRTGERVAFADDFTLSATTLTVTTDPLTRDVTLNGVTAWDRLTSDSSPTLELLPGDMLSVLMTGTTAESKIDISWRQRWRTP